MTGWLKEYSNISSVFQVESDVFKHKTIIDCQDWQPLQNSPINT